MSTFKDKLLKASNHYPVVTILGPRGAGKATLVRAAFSHKAYTNLETKRTYEFANLDPRGFLDGYHDGGIFDEIQNVPKLLPLIRDKVDACRHKCQYVLIASDQVELKHLLPQVLGDRTAILKLFPQEGLPTKAYRSFLHMLLKKGVSMDFLKFCAKNIGKEIDKKKFANEIEILEDYFVIFFLPNSSKLYFIDPEFAAFLHV